MSSGSADRGAREPQPGRNWLLGSDRAGFDVAAARVPGEDHAARGDGSVDRGEGRGNRAALEELLAAAEGDRVDHERELVDQVVLEQGLDEVAAAPDGEVGVAGFLEGADVVDAGQKVRVAPVGGVRGRR